MAAAGGITCRCCWSECCPIPRCCCAQQPMPANSGARRWAVTCCCGSGWCSCCSVWQRPSCAMPALWLQRAVRADGGGAGQAGIRPGQQLLLPQALVLLLLLVLPGALTLVMPRVKDALVQAQLADGFSPSLLSAVAGIAGADRLFHARATYSHSAETAAQRCAAQCRAVGAGAASSGGGAATAGQGSRSSGWCRTRARRRW